MRCLITGAGLYLGDGVGYHGDLHEEGDCYIFNAVLRQDHPDSLLLQVSPTGDRTLAMRPEAPHFFERRGVCVIPKESAYLSDGAFAYINKERDHG